MVVKPDGTIVQRVVEFFLRVTVGHLRGVQGDVLEEIVNAP